MADRVRLDSWKEVAQFLQRDVKTVMRWHRERGLPVHRVPGGRLARVFAFQDELDHWLHRASQDSPEGEIAESPVPKTVVAGPGARRGRTLVVSLTGLALLVVVILGMVQAGRGRPSGLHELVISGSEVVALDGTGARLWAHDFSRALRSGSGVWSSVNDLDGDRGGDALAVVSEETGSQLFEDRLFRFGAGGVELWRDQPLDRVRFREVEYGPPWPSAALATYKVNGERRIAWAVHHFTWWPGLLVTLNTRGERLGTFVNAGWIRAVAATPDGKHILATGVRHASQGYFLAVLDAASPSGHSPEVPGSETECRSCPAGAPLHYYVFQPTDLGKAFPFPLDSAGAAAFDDGSVHVPIIESNTPKLAEAIYEIGPDFAPRRVRLSDSFAYWHRRMESEGRLRHTFDACPERRGRDVQHWTPAGGWKTVHVPAR